MILGHEDPLEKEMATYSSILAWKIPWTEEPGYSPWVARVRHYLETKQPVTIRVFASVTPEPSPRDIKMLIYSNNYSKCSYFINITCIN